MLNEQLDKYRLISLLATGGMGEVFLARHEGPGGFQKSVVIKRILRHLASDQGFIEMFKNEARLAAQLQHPNIVQIFELGHDPESDTWFIAMEFVHGRSLRACIEHAAALHQRCPPRIAARVVADALHGLGFAHRLTDERGNPLGLLHRDISPDNVLVGFSGQVKLVDFGIAKATAGANAVTRTGALKGKFSYMAPEQFVSGATLDPRTDLYAAGVLLHELLTNERPSCTPRNSDDALAPRGPFVPRDDLPPALNDILRRALAPDREERWGSADEMAQALEAFVQSSSEALNLSHVARWVGQLFGEDVATANPAVAPVQSAPLSTAVLSGPVRLVPATGPEAEREFSTAQTVIESAYQPGQSAEPERVTRPDRASAMSEADPTRLEAPRPPERPSAGRRRSRPAWLATIGLSAVVGLAVGLLVLLPVLNQRPSEARDAGHLAVVAPVPPPAEPAPEPEAGVLALPGIDLVPDDSGVDAGAVASGRPEGPDEPRTRPPRRRPPPKSGKVSIRVNPWAEVHLGARNYGITPLPGPIEVPAGTATFTLRNKQLGVTRKVSVKVPAGGEVVLKADLFKKER